MVLRQLISVSPLHVGPDSRLRRRPDVGCPYFVRQHEVPHSRWMAQPTAGSCSPLRDRVACDGTPTRPAGRRGMGDGGGHAHGIVPFADRLAGRPTVLRLMAVALGVINVHGGSVGRLQNSAADGRYRQALPTSTARPQQPAGALVRALRPRALLGSTFTPLRDAPREGPAIGDDASIARLANGVAPYGPRVRSLPASPSLARPSRRAEGCGPQAGRHFDEPLGTPLATLCHLRNRGRGVDVTLERGLTLS
jgi:hypothetical protein